ncbi:inner nuclear membrane protein Man1-like [Teleopsis dalmanni]|uniref:inner nuclear membrane protein Man1-like n=1 Tax=Teleopsis dalmanni TaxID=139649 RepID=UPI0018CCAB3A|nr:inner nuclear membrane protein Man1-like [Teleopsis dalmanni]
MRMEDVDKLTDHELRKQLTHYGLPNMPITETTRRLLLEKLKRKIYQEKQEMKLRKRNTRTSSPVKQSGYSLGGPLDYASNAQNNLKIQPELENIPAFNYIPTSSNFTTNNLSERYSMPVMDSIDDNFYQQLLRAEKYNVHDPNMAMNSFKTQPMYTNNTYVNQNYTPHPPADLYYQNNYSPKTSLDTNAVCAGGDPNSNNTHFGIVNKLLSLRSKSLPKQNSYNMNETDMATDRRLRSSNADKKITTKRLIQHLINRVLYKPELRQSFVPHVLIILFFIFFISLAAIYMMIRPNIPATHQIENTNVKICELDMVAEKGMLSTCVENERLEEVKTYIRELLTLLQKRAVHYHCIDSSISAAVSKEEFIKYVLDNLTSTNMNNVDFNIHAMQHLIRANSQLNVKIMSNETNSVDTNSNAVERNVITQFLLAVPQLPFKCILFNKLHTFFIIIGTGAVIGAIVLLAYNIYLRIKRSSDERNLLVKQYSEEIVNELLYQTSLKNETGTGELILNHLRDKLIPINKRKASLWSWDEAIRLLEANDSRIQFCISLHNGEEFRTLKWIGQLNQNEIKINAKKQWQSPAFDNVNKVHNPPTPCLKIRHMFDNSDIQNPNLKQIIKDAILEKVGSRCSMKDLQIDKNTCCVYIRCPKEEDAGIIHNEINGWWFDNRLVSIKFLRLQRYLSRYPNAIET